MNGARWFVLGATLPFLTLFVVVSVVAAGCGPVGEEEGAVPVEVTVEDDVSGPPPTGADAGMAPEEEAGDGRAGRAAAAFCVITPGFVTPVAPELYLPGSYESRRFLRPPTHLGEDIALPEGTPVATVCTGRIAYYGPATGYGELLAAVECDLGEPQPFESGNGETVWTRFVLVIYGHLRTARSRGEAGFSYRPGECVGAGSVLGYVNDDAHNGDGREHLHLGIRLMSAEEARTRDGRYAYRGYDHDGVFRGDFTSPEEAVIGAAVREPEAPVEEGELPPEPEPEPEPEEEVPPPDPPPPEEEEPPPPSPPESRTLSVALSSTFQATCRTGFVIVAWDNLGRPVESSPGMPLALPVGADWHGFLMITVRCGGYWHDWSPWVGTTARLVGFASILLGALELSDAETMVCRDPYGGGAKPAIPLDGALFGRCP